MSRLLHKFGASLREAAQSLDRLGLAMVVKDDAVRKPYSFYRPIMNLFEKRPRKQIGVFVAPNAAVIGGVRLQSDASIWYGAVLRADKAMIWIGKQTNIQDRAVINTTISDVIIGERVVVGHGAIITSSTIDGGVLIGQGAIIQEGSVIQSGAIVAAGSVVLPGSLVKKDTLVAGNPAVFIRNTEEYDKTSHMKTVFAYVDLAREHDSEFVPKMTPYIDE